jgi:hypothetical protein
MRTLGLCAALLALIAPAPAQKIYDTANENVANPIFQMTGAAWFVHKRANAAPVVLTGAQFLSVKWNPSAIPLEVGIWDEDTVTGLPRNLLGSGAFAMPLNVPGYHGATFATPVALSAAGNYFVGIKLPNAIVANSTSGSVVTPYWFNPGSGWVGPVTGKGLSFRVYAGSHLGAAVAFGVGKAGTGSFVPLLEGVGWPNTTNPIGFRLTQALDLTPCVFLLGPRTATPLPFGMLYAQPLVAIAATTIGAGAGTGYAELGLVVPNDPSLHGQKLAAQVFVADPGASSGISHTAGLELTLGH